MRRRASSTVGGGDAAAERLALLGGSLWITGRGLALLEVDPETGATRRSIDIGGTGIDVVAAAGSLWIPVRTAEVDRTGFPDDDRASPGHDRGNGHDGSDRAGRVDVHGLAAGKRRVWLADNTQGVLYRIPT